MVQIWRYATVVQGRCIKSDLQTSHETDTHEQFTIATAFCKQCTDMVELLGDFFSDMQ